MIFSRRAGLAAWFSLFLCPSLCLAAWEIGTEISRITYREPGLMRESGVMTGIAAAYSRRAPPFAYSEQGEWLFRLEGRLAQGAVDYDGQLSSGTPYRIKGINDFIFEARALAGYTFSRGGRLEKTLYAGIGYRYLNDDSSFDPAGYERESNYLYCPLGIELVLERSRGWKAGLRLEYDLFLGGRQVTHLEDVDPAFNTLSNKQKSGYGARASVLFAKKGGPFDILIEPFIRYWKINASEAAEWTYYGSPIGYGFEPDNNSTETGLRLSLGF